MNYKVFKDYIYLIFLFIIISFITLLIINSYNKTVKSINNLINNKNNTLTNKSKIENFNIPNIFIFNIFAIKKNLLNDDEYKSEYDNKKLLEYCQNIVNNQSNFDKKKMIINKVKTKINYKSEKQNKVKLNFYDDDNIIYLVRINLNSSNTSADYNIKLNDSFINDDKINHNNTKNILEFTIDNNVIKYISKNSIELITNISEDVKTPTTYTFDINKKYISIQNILGISENTNYLDPSIINEFDNYYKLEQEKQNENINDIENRINQITKNLKIVI